MQQPARIIFSRKGFDSAAGGIPSPILDGALVSLPIPARDASNTTYGDIGFGEIVHDLTRGAIGASHPCHRDPDLRMGAFGQLGPAQSHLSRHAVGPGDLFLFWGLFRRVSHTSSGYRYVAKARREHWIFGWLQVSEVLHLGPDGSWAAEHYPRLSGHPHCRSGWPVSNTLYLATEDLRLRGTSVGLPGAGIFPSVSEALRLSTPDGPTSVWRVPRWLNPQHGGVGMTYHSALDRWADETVQTVGRGQEFVTSLANRSDAWEWLEALFACHAAPRSEQRLVSPGEVDNGGRGCGSPTGWRTSATTRRTYGAGC
jgi:hypothetical protein